MEIVAISEKGIVVMRKFTLEEKRKFMVCLSLAAFLKKTEKGDQDETPACH